MKKPQRVTEAIARTGTNPKLSIGLTKAPLRLVPPALLIETSVVMAVGGAKYDPYNWRTAKVSRLVYLEAIMRHLLAALDGEDADPETGRPHEASIAACCAIALDALQNGNLIDDRYKSGKVPEALRAAAKAANLAVSRVKRVKVRRR